MKSLWLVFRYGKLIKTEQLSKWLMQICEKAKLPKMRFYDFVRPAFIGLWSKVCPTKKHLLGQDFDHYKNTKKRQFIDYKKFTAKRNSYKKQKTTTYCGFLGKIETNYTMR